MMTKSELQELVGKEFTIREPEDLNIYEIELRLSAVIRLDKSVLEDWQYPAEEICYERDRVLILFKQELERLLWKYLGRIPE